jgi:hypothetical protein
LRFSRKTPISLAPIVSACSALAVRILSVTNAGPTFVKNARTTRVHPKKSADVHKSGTRSEIAVEWCAVETRENSGMVEACLEWQLFWSRNGNRALLLVPCVLFYEPLYRRKYIIFYCNEHVLNSTRTYHIILYYAHFKWYKHKRDLADLCAFLKNGPDPIFLTHRVIIFRISEFILIRWSRITMFMYITNERHVFLKAEVCK